MRICETRHDKTNKMSVCPAKTQISLSSLSAWRKLGSLATHWGHSEDSDQTGRMPRLIWVFAGRRVILLVLSCRGSCDENCLQFISFTPVKLFPLVFKVLPFWRFLRIGIGKHEQTVHTQILNPHLPSGLFHPYQLDESISNFRGVLCTFSFLFYFE